MYDRTAILLNRDGKNFISHNYSAYIIIELSMAKNKNEAIRALMDLIKQQKDFRETKMTPKEIEKKHKCYVIKVDNKTGEYEQCKTYY